MTRNGMIQAAHDTLELAAQNGMNKHPRPASNTCSTHYHHLEGMLERMNAEFMPDDKLGRWLGWMQCAVVVAGCGTLEDMKTINTRCDAGPAKADFLTPPEARTE